MRGTVTAVGFDLDGTLFDHRGSATDGVRLFLRGLGADPTDEAIALWFTAEQAEFEHWRAGRISFQEQRRRRIRRVLTALDIDFDNSSAGLDRLFERYLKEYQRAWRPYADVLDVLSALRGRGLRLGLLTNGSEHQQLGKLAVTGLAGLFDAVCVSEAIGVQKPDIRAFDTLAQSLEVESSRCLFVGDHPDQDVAGAVAAGMRAVLIDRHREGAPGLWAAIEAQLG